jgi:hypothetical protein
MVRIRMLLLTAVLVATGALTSGALAGGWAVATLDPIARDLAPGQSVEIGYTIRQHGRTPVDLADTGIEIRPGGDPPVFYPGRRQGPVGHYVARITVPSAGAQWTARQGWFPPQPLGAVPVVRTAAPPAAEEGSRAGALQRSLLAASALRALALCVQLVARLERTAATAGAQ